MLRTLLTPLSTRFAPTPFPDSPGIVEEEELSPEDFAQEVLIELMRDAVEKLKGAQDAPSRTNVLIEISRIIQEGRCTKDIFREADGFLLLINALLTVDVGGLPVMDVLEQTRLVFEIMSEAMKQHSRNSDYFFVSSLRHFD